MKRMLVLIVLAVSGCASPSHDYTMFCEVSMNGECLQAGRFQTLYSVQQVRVAP